MLCREDCKYEPDSSGLYKFSGMHLYFTGDSLGRLYGKAAKEAGINYKIGKFPFTASGKASAGEKKDGFVKLVIDADSDVVLGAHFIGANVTEMISGIVVARKLGVTAKDIIHSIHPHPTMSEAIMEAAASAHGRGNTFIK